MARPRKSRCLEGVPEPIIYIPHGWTNEQPVSADIAIEDFEVMRLVDGHAYSLQDAAVKVGVSKSTAGRMLERGRRALVLTIERRAPFYLDASDDLTMLDPMESAEPNAGDPTTPKVGRFAVAVDEACDGAVVSRIFGRATAFAVFQDKSSAPEFVKNPGCFVARNAAQEAVDCLNEMGVEWVVAGRFGADALTFLGDVGIRPITAPGIRLKKAVNFFC